MMLKLAILATGLVCAVQVGATEIPLKNADFEQAIKLDPTLDEAKITVAMTRLDAIWDQLFPAEQTRIVKLLVEKVIVSPNDLEVRLRANGIERLVLVLPPK